MALPTKTDLSTLVLPGVKPVEYFKIANVFQDDIMKAIESGMNEHVTKPVDMKLVCRILQKWLKK